MTITDTPSSPETSPEFLECKEAIAKLESLYRDFKGRFGNDFRTYLSGRESVNSGFYYALQGKNRFTTEDGWKIGWGADQPGDILSGFQIQSPNGKHICCFGGGGDVYLDNQGNFYDCGVIDLNARVNGDHVKSIDSEGVHVVEGEAFKREVHATFERDAQLIELEHTQRGARNMLRKWSGRLTPDQQEYNLVASREVPPAPIVIKPYDDFIAMLTTMAQGIEKLISVFEQKTKPR